MRERLTTRFWREALQSLPAHIRDRYAPHFAAAERRELGLDAALAALSRVFHR